MENTNTPALRNDTTDYYVNFEVDMIFALYIQCNLLINAVDKTVLEQDPLINFHQIID